MNDSEEEGTPGDQGISCLVCWSEGMDDTVFVGFEDESEEGTLDGE